MDSYNILDIFSDRPFMAATYPVLKSCEMIEKQEKKWFDSCSGHFKGDEIKG